MKKILVTGCFGFIGFNFIKSLPKNLEVYAVDLKNNLKEEQKERRRELKKLKEIKFINLDISSENDVKKKLGHIRFDYIVHLAAKAGVRASMKDPDLYFKTNIIGFRNIINLCLIKKPEKLIYASSSSVYSCDNYPVSENSNSSFQTSFYAKTKKINEQLAEEYSKIFNVNIIGLRFFSVYGPWGRRDMAPFIFLDSIMKNKKIYLNNSGKNLRDFTYIGDVTMALNSLLKTPLPQGHSIFNICSGKTYLVSDLLLALQKKVGRSAKIINRKSNPLDVYKTHGTSKKIEKALGCKIEFSLENGIVEFIDWYKKNVFK
ncbi:NAD-dependent epimerase/dehydratase family protein [SAR86 cluster bacterium]|nr:NAD-dependent epimerase/dehydratase family protein [SAR86 cluster bacterium]